MQIQTHLFDSWKLPPPTSAGSVEEARAAIRFAQQLVKEGFVLMPLARTRLATDFVVFRPCEEDGALLEGFLFSLPDRLLVKLAPGKAHLVETALAKAHQSLRELFGLLVDEKVLPAPTEQGKVRWGRRR